MELYFKNTCKGCPEQYDVYNKEDDSQVGYVRLRHGYMSVRVPDNKGREIYGVDTEGDGAFWDMKERETYLTKSAEFIKHYLSIKNDFSSPGDFTIIV